MAQESVPISSQPSGEETAARIWAALHQRLQEAGTPITVSGAKIASALGIAANVFRAHLKDLVDSGQLVKLGAGLAGTTLALPSMVDVPAASPVPAGEPPLGDGAGVGPGGADEAVAATPKAGPVPVQTPPASPAEEMDEAEAGPRVPVRQRIHDAVRSAIRAGDGEAVLTADRLAAAVGTSAATAAYHIKALSALGHLTTERAGRMGMRIRLAPRRAPSSASTAAGRADAPAGFCPWCGRGIGHRDWKFCHACGQELPH